MQEEWRDVDDYEGYYQVSSRGRVKSLDRIDNIGRCLKGRILKTCPNNNGYLHGAMAKNGIVKTFLVSRLVAKAFIPNPLNLPEVNHKNEKRHKNHSDNLEWCTREYNTKYGKRCKYRKRKKHKRK